MKIVIIDYGSGNIQSIQFALQRLGFESYLSKDISHIMGADKVIFPGVGEASTAMKKLRDSGLIDIIPNLKQPVLGICLGMQLMCKATEEGKTTGLGIFDCEVFKFSKIVKVPQIGWNNIYNFNSKLFDGISEQEYMYLIHSYYAPKCAETIALANYDIEYSVGLCKDNFYGVQFHPEKSGKAGEQILANFLKL